MNNIQKLKNYYYQSRFFVTTLNFVDLNAIEPSVSWIRTLSSHLPVDEAMRLAIGHNFLGCMNYFTGETSRPWIDL